MTDLCTEASVGLPYRPDYSMQHYELANKDYGTRSVEPDIDHRQAQAPTLP